MPRYSVGVQESVNTISVGVWMARNVNTEYYALVIERQADICYWDLIRKLDKRFGFKELPETAHIRFMQAKQNSEEALEDWAGRVSGLNRSPVTAPVIVTTVENPATSSVTAQRSGSRTKRLLRQ